MDVEKVIEAGARAWSENANQRWDAISVVTQDLLRSHTRACLTAALAEARAQGAVLAVVPEALNLRNNPLPYERGSIDGYNAAIAAMRAGEVGL